ncbi:MAG TPA: hypothetical protein VFT52_01065, partial [Luteimonas sp.]|nr:hypothetical protein [Luteimonas sp.]
MRHEFVPGRRECEGSCRGAPWIRPWRLLENIPVFEIPGPNPRIRDDGDRAACAFVMPARFCR